MESIIRSMICVWLVNCQGVWSWARGRTQRTVLLASSPGLSQLFFFHLQETKVEPGDEATAQLPLDGCGNFSAFACCACARIRV